MVVWWCQISAHYPQLNGTIIGSFAKWNGEKWFGTNRGLYSSVFRDKGIHFNGTANGLQHETVTALATSTDGECLVVGTLCGVDFLKRGRTFWDIGTVKTS